MTTNPEGTKAKLDAKGVGGDCEACGRNSWSISDDRYALVLLDGMALTDKALPLHIMVCDHCGFVRHFHADIL
jgi:hypothetical protein